MTEQDLLPLLELHINHQAPIYADDDSDSPQNITLSLTNQTYSSSTGVKLTPSDEITLLQLYLYLKYFGKGNVEYIKHSSSNRLSLNVRKIVDKILGLSARFKPDTIIRKPSENEVSEWIQKYQQITVTTDASQDISKKRLASALESQTDIGKVEKESKLLPRKRFRTISEIDNALESETTDEIISLKQEFSQFIDSLLNQEEPMTDVEESRISKYKDFIDLSKRNLELISTNLKIQPYINEFVGTFSFINSKSYNKIEWKKVLESYKLIQNDLKYREKHGDDSKIPTQNISLPRISDKNLPDKVNDEFGGFDPMGSNLDDISNTQISRNEDRRREDEARARQQLLLQQQLEAQKVPSKIIIVPAAISSLISISNAKQFFEEGKFVSPEESNSLSSVKPNKIQIRVRNSSNNLETYIVTDRPQNLQPNDWKRVVAIFTNGKEWEFKNCRYTNPTELFSKYPGFSLIYDDQQIPPNIKKWPIKILRISKLKRHLDNPISKEFWKKIERV